MDRIYLDHAATSPLRDEVWRAMDAARGEADHNPASTHAYGRAASDHLETARRTLAGLLGGPRERVFLTGGGTPSDNLAVLGFVRAHRQAEPRVLVSAVEHKAVLEAAERAAAEGAAVNRIPVDEAGVVKLEALEELLGEASRRPTLVSVMWANNETGAVQPVGDVVEVAHARGARVHTDAVQAFGKLAVSVESVPVDLLTVTAHKLGGPVGIGLLYVREGVEIEPLTFGGTQERGLWPGTQNPMAATGFAAAARLAAGERPEATRRWTAMREELVEELRAAVPGLRVRAAGAARRLPHLLNVAVPDVDGAALLASLDLGGVALSSGSACSSGSVEPSHVLQAMGEPGPDRVATLRFSFGASTTGEEVKTAAEAVKRVVGRLRGGTGDPASGGPSAPARRPDAEGAPVRSATEGPERPGGGG